MKKLKDKHRIEKNRYLYKTIVSDNNKQKLNHLSKLTPSNFIKHLVLRNILMKWEKYVRNKHYSCATEVFKHKYSNSTNLFKPIRALVTRFLFTTYLVTSSKRKLQLEN